MEKKAKDNLLDKSLKIIQAFIDHNESWGVRELAAYLDYTVPTTHRILLQLKEHSILDYDEHKNRYIVGTELIRISAKVASRSSLQSIARPFLKALAKKYEETICLLMLRKDTREIFWADKVNGPKPLQYIIPLGELQSLPYGSSGKSILAFLDEDIIDEILKDDKFTEKEVATIKKELIKIREERYHYSVSERLEGSSGIGSPIFNSDNEPIASIILTAPTPRVTKEVIESASVDIKNTAKEISSILGATK
ncbi:IclR family transcriptional regulator [Oceanobacillus sp. FSL W7-1293]|uniref:IclR family transcriptional regulator n=1 Tax=Oceanobacillus TaxID=182709 RepID=UPI0030CF4ADC